MSAEPMSTEAMPAAVWLPFQQWRLAFAALRKAEAQRQSHAELVRLSEEVIHTRNILIAARLADGFTLPGEAVRQVEADTELLKHPDDAAAPNRQRAWNARLGPHRTTRSPLRLHVLGTTLISKRQNNAPQ
jgi:hypothetical protein